LNGDILAVRRPRRPVDERLKPFQKTRVTSVAVHLVEFDRVVGLELLALAVRPVWVWLLQSRVMDEQDVLTLRGR
jgi:hypothetical protein